VGESPRAKFGRRRTTLKAKPTAPDVKMTTNKAKTSTGFTAEHPIKCEGRKDVVVTFIAMEITAFIGSYCYKKRQRSHYRTKPWKGVDLDLACEAETDCSLAGRDDDAWISSLKLAAER